MLGTLAGGAAGCQFWHQNLGVKCRLHELSNKRIISVTGASKLLANILYSYRGMGLSVGTMIAGWDEKEPGLYYADSEGGRLKGTHFSVGSGSPYAYGILDDGYRPDLSIEEPAELARRAIYHATFRDGASGGVASAFPIPDLALESFIESLRNTIKGLTDQCHGWYIDNGRVDTAYAVYHFFLAVYYVRPDRWKKLSGDDVGELHYKYYPVQLATVE